METLINSFSTSERHNDRLLSPLWQLSRMDKSWLTPIEVAILMYICEHDGVYTIDELPTLISSAYKVRLEDVRKSLWHLYAWTDLIGNGNGDGTISQSIGNYLGRTPIKFDKFSMSAEGWRELEFPKIREFCKKNEMIIVWIDELAHLPDTDLSYFVGTTESGLLFYMQRDDMTKYSFLNFISYIDCFLGRKVMFALDQINIHMGREVELLFDCHADRLGRFYLPVHTSLWNPVEHVFIDIKRRSRKTRSPEERISLMNARLDEYQLDASLVKNLFNLPTTRYARVYEEASS